MTGRLDSLAVESEYWNINSFLPHPAKIKKNCNNNNNIEVNILISEIILKRLDHPSHNHSRSAAVSICHWLCDVRKGQKQDWKFILTVMLWYEIWSNFIKALKAARNADYTEKYFKQKFYRIKFLTKNLVNAYLYFLQEWS